MLTQKTTITLLFLALFLPMQAQVTIFPEVDKVKNSRRIEIVKVELTDEFTIIDFYYAPIRTENSTVGEWICVSNKYYITPAKMDMRKYLIMAKNVSICPKSTKVITTQREDITYQLYFPPLETGIYKIDIIEKKSGGTNFYGVHINNQRDRNAPDSVPYRNQVAFMKYFYTHKDRLDKIEGLWKLDIRQQHFFYHDRYAEDLTTEPQVVAIMKKGNLFITYGEHGNNRDEYFRKLTGKKGYFFRKKIPEVESEASGYIVFGNPNQFFIKYILPDRLAHYYLLKDYMSGDKLYEIAKYTRIPVENPIIKTNLLEIKKDSIK
ncbi:MAG TPA: hypothetical protein ENK25_09100 [Bacteroidetes bacterium]|nr:hypothetical protein [Bacteroidota bacterium]